MPIIFISLNDEFIQEIKKHSFIGHVDKIQNYHIKRKTYYVSPANSLGFMDGGIDLTLSRIIFPGIELNVKEQIKKYGQTNLIDRKYLPIGSSIIIDCQDKSLVISPTMLLPQNVKNTQNAFYSTMASLYNVLINRKEDLNNIDIIFTSMCCGYGQMDPIDSATQIIKAINNYQDYTPQIINESVILFEPNLDEQPNTYENSEFKKLKGLNL